MKIVKVEVFPLILPLKEPLMISGGVVGHPRDGAPHVYVRITDECGCTGWGEARPSPRWSYETIETVSSTIRSYFTPVLIGTEASDLQDVQRKLNQQIAQGLCIGQPIAKAAVDIALHDLICQHRHQRLSELWLSAFQDGIQLSYLISTKDPEEAARRAKYAVEHGYKGVDVKIGFSIRQDIEILEAVKAQAPHVFFRADANQAYSVPQAIQIAKHMERIGIDVFEQALDAHNLLGFAELRRKTHIPIALDESIWSVRDLLQAIRLEACDYAVIKLTKMGGFHGAKLCGEVAKEAKLGLLGGGLTESRLGLAASAHLFNYLGIREPVDLNGPLFIQDDPVAVGPNVQDGTVTLPDGFGLGCTISQEKLEAYQVRIDL